jgi:hypothetical protein
LYSDTAIATLELLQNSRFADAKLTASENCPITVSGEFNPEKIKQTLDIKT